MSLTDGLLLTVVSAAICISLPKLLSILLTDHSKKLIIPALQETLPEAPSTDVSTLVIEG